MTSLTRLQVSAAVVSLALAMSANLSASTVYATSLSGANENPSNASTATGFGSVTINGNSLSIFETFSGLSAPATGAHIHCCGPLGVNEPVALPFTNYPNVTSGTYSNTFDLTLTSTYTSAFLATEGGSAAGAEAGLLAGLSSGQAYLNIHDSIFAAGEIRGQLQLSPEPSTSALFLLALVPLGWPLLSKLRAQSRQS